MKVIEYTPEMSKVLDKFVRARAQLSKFELTTKLTGEDLCLNNEKTIQQAKFDYDGTINFKKMFVDAEKTLKLNLTVEKEKKVYFGLRSLDENYIPYDNTLIQKDLRNKLLVPKRTSNFISQG